MMKKILNICIWIFIVVVFMGMVFCMEEENILCGMMIDLEEELLIGLIDV